MDIQNSKCRMNNWDKNDEKMINEQINIELNAAHIYNSLAAHFNNDSVGFITQYSVCQVI